MWIISTMMENEWNEDPAERKFIQSNFVAANRGVEIERIFIFNRSDYTKFKENTYIKRYLASNKIQSKFVDSKILKDKRNYLLNTINNGLIGTDDYALLLDLPSDGTSRGYVILNKIEIEKAKKCFNEFQELAIPLKEIFKQ